jgi:N-acyl homoserine lactone hydrolase
MTTPVVSILLNGFSVGSDQGNFSFCGAYLVEATDSGGQQHRVLYDSGHAGRRKALQAALAARGLRTSDIDTVVLSHGHWDHIQNVDLFSDTRVLIHADELRYLDAPKANDHATPPWTKSLLAFLDVHESGEGDEIIPGVTVIELPGHTPGSIGLTVETADGLAVLTGDAVATAGVLRSGQCSGVFFDIEKADASVRRVNELADIVYPGHDRPFRVADEPGYLIAPVPITLRVADPEAAKAGVRYVRGTQGKRFVLPGIPGSNA